jgi:hypothetical protein
MSGERSSTLALLRCWMLSEICCAISLLRSEPRAVMVRMAANANTVRNRTTGTMATHRGMPFERVACPFNKQMWRSSSQYVRPHFGHVSRGIVTTSLHRSFIFFVCQYTRRSQGLSMNHLRLKN